jgi:hypothetical protein
MQKLAAVLTVTLAAPLATFAEDAPAKEEAPKVVFSGLVDAYYTANLTQSQEMVNPLRAHDGVTGFNLNWAKLGATMDADPVGFKIDLAFGPESYYTTDTFVLQAYASAKLGPGVLDFGQFTTAAGFELYESNGNWLYTRGLIYWFIEPTVHQGARYTMDLGNGLTLQTSLTNGWESPNAYVIDRVGNGQLSPYKTGQLSAFYAADALTGAVNVYFGKEPGAEDYRVLLDGNVGYVFGALETNLSAAYRTEGDDKRMGVNLSARYSVNDQYRIAGRFEYLKDDGGVALGIPDGGNAWNVSANVGRLMGEHVEMKAEVRYDKVSEDYFFKTPSEADISDNAITAHFAVLAWF